MLLRPTTQNTDVPAVEDRLRVGNAFLLEELTGVKWAERGNSGAHLVEGRVPVLDGWAVTGGFNHNLHHNSNDSLYHSSSSSSRSHQEASTAAAAAAAAAAAGNDERSKAVSDGSQHTDGITGITTDSNTNGGGGQRREEEQQREGENDDGDGGRRRGRRGLWVNLNPLGSILHHHPHPHHPPKEEDGDEKNGNGDGHHRRYYKSHEEACALYDDYVHSVKMAVDVIHVWLTEVLKCPCAHYSPPSSFFD